jgi:hypothetical protein
MKEFKIPCFDLHHTLARMGGEGCCHMVRVKRNTDENRGYCKFAGNAGCFNKDIDKTGITLEEIKERN